MSAKIEYLPGSQPPPTPGDRMMHLAELAKLHPERFQKVIVIYAEETEAEDKFRYMSYACSTIELLGMLEQAKEEIHNITRGSRVK